MTPRPEVGKLTLDQIKKRPGLYHWYSPRETDRSLRRWLVIISAAGTAWYDAEKNEPFSGGSTNEPMERWLREQDSTFALAKGTGLGPRRRLL